MAMAKSKDHVSKTFKIRADLAKRLDEYREKTGVPNTFAVEKALEKYLDEVAPISDNDDKA